MSLYLCVFHGGEEVAGVDVGGYSDFGNFRDTIAKDAEGSTWGSRYPIFMGQPDDNGEWGPSDLSALRGELEDLASRSDLTTFVDSDGLPVAESLLRLCDLAIQLGEPILFQ